MRKRRHEPLPSFLPVVNSHQLRLWGWVGPGEPGSTSEPVLAAKQHQDGEDHAAQDGEDVEDHAL